MSFPFYTISSGEKTKWVPIPPEELQAAADAMHRFTQHRSHRIGSQQNSRTHSPRMTPQASSSQTQTRLHSGRNSTSNSVSQSRVHSQPGSVQSSPQLVRGKRLPGDEFLPSSAVERTISNKSSGRNSPRFQLPHRGSVLFSEPLMPAPVAYPTPPYHPPPQGTSHYPLPAFDNTAHYSPHPALQPGVNLGDVVTPPPLPSPFYPGVVPYPIYARHLHYEFGGHPQRTYSPWNTPPENLPEDINLIPPRIPPIFLDQPQYTNGTSLLRPSSSQILPPTPEVRGTGKPVVFGSVGKSPSPSAHTFSPSLCNDQKGPVSFSIGLEPEKGGVPRLRRTHPPKIRHMVPLQTNAPSRAVTSKWATGYQNETCEDTTGTIAGTAIENATNSFSIQWKFGTTSELSGEGMIFSDATPPGDHIEHVLPQSFVQNHELFPNPLSPSYYSGLPSSATTSYVPIPTPLPHELAGLKISGNNLRDEWEVRNFGYGFGSTSGPSPVPNHTVRFQGTYNQTEVGGEGDTERGKPHEGKEDRERESQGQRDNGLGRPRRGSYGPHGGYDRGGYGGRRGRGNNGISRGRGYHRGNLQIPPHQQQPHFNITPPPHFQPLVAVGDPPNGVYNQPRQPLTTYIPTGYENYPPPLVVPSAQITPPVPIPLSPISFPLDPTRYYLLGQLEYYLSSQNLAQDYFLRQKVRAPV